MSKRTGYLRELGVSIIMYDYLTRGFTTNTSMASLLLQTEESWYTFHVLAKALSMSSKDRIHSSTIVVVKVLITNSSKRLNC